MVEKNNTPSWFIDTNKKIEYTEKYCKDYNLRVMNKTKDSYLWNLSINTPYRIWLCRKGSRCGRYHICPVCSDIKRKERYNKYKHLFIENWYCGNKNRLFFLTLTIGVSKKLGLLKNKTTKYLTLINKNMKKNKKSSFYLFDWYVVSIEKKCDNGVWNLHLHFLIKTKKEENKEKLFVGIKKEWEYISWMEQIDIQNIIGECEKERIENSLKVIDYINKWDNSLLVEDKFDFMKVFFKVSTFRNYGCFKKDLQRKKDIQENKVEECFDKKISIYQIILYILSKITLSFVLFTFIILYYVYCVFIKKKFLKYIFDFL